MHSQHSRRRRHKSTWKKIRPIIKVAAWTAGSCTALAIILSLLLIEDLPDQIAQSDEATDKAAAHVRTLGTFYNAYKNEFERSEKAINNEKAYFSNVAQSVDRLSKAEPSRLKPEQELPSSDSAISNAQIFETDSSIFLESKSPIKF